MCELLQIGITFSGFYANLHEESSQQICGNREEGAPDRDTRGTDVMRIGGWGIEYSQEIKNEGLM